MKMHPWNKRKAEEKMHNCYQDGKAMKPTTADEVQIYLGCDQCSWVEICKVEQELLEDWLSE
jgi:hypothetical protein